MPKVSKSTRTNLQELKESIIAFLQTGDASSTARLHVIALKKLPDLPFSAVIKAVTELKAEKRIVVDRKEGRIPIYAAAAAKAAHKAATKKLAGLRKSAAKASPPTPEVPASPQLLPASAARFGVFNDGTVTIAKGGMLIELMPEETLSLVTFTHRIGVQPQPEARK